MIIKIDPLDTLFFRDGKPFTMGEDTWANGIFPPPPSVIYGALRSAYFSNHIDELKKATQSDDPTKNLKINGVYFWDKKTEKIHLPLPNDCVQEKDGEEKSVVLSRDGLRGAKSSCPTQDILTSLRSEVKVKNVERGLINEESLKKYLSGTGNSFSPVIKMADRVLQEPKIGIGIDNKTGTSEEGKLYRVGMNRLDNLSLLIDFEGMNLPESGMMKLGGEGKAVSYKEYEESKPVSFSVDKSKLDGTRFKLYLSTPAIFKKGWLPDLVDENTLEGEYKGLKLKLLTAAIGKPIHIGGFDMKSRKPKPMYKTVPAGSVYYFEIIEGDFQKALEIFDHTAISDVSPKQGFGIAYVGGCR